MPKFDITTVPEEHRQRVESLVPDPRIADQYVNRHIDGFEDFEMLDVAMENRRNVMLTGPTGASKTTVFRAYAASRGLPFALVECNAAMDPGTVLGRTTIVEGGEVKWVDGDFTLIVRYGGVALIDEINLAHPRITAGFHQLLAVTRRLSIPESGETIKAGCGGFGDPQPCLFGTALNRGTEYQGIVRLNAALRNRFPIKLEWGYLREIEEQLIRSHRLLDLADSIRDLAEIRTPVSTNMLQEFETHVQLFDIFFALRVFVNGFEPDERAPVSRALDANLAAIAEELGVTDDLDVVGSGGEENDG